MTEGHEDETEIADTTDRVIVDGKTIVENGEVLTIDVPEVVRRVNEASKRVWDRLDF